MWKFNPTLKNDPKACEIDFAVSFAFKNRSHSLIAKLFLDSVVRNNVNAFIERAQVKYGPPSRESERKSYAIQGL